MENYYELPQFLCLENLVGISRKECECLAEVSQELEHGVRHSETGLYIDEHEGATSCLFLENAYCGEGDIWSKLILARREAVLQMIVDTSVTLDSRYSAINNYSHHLGEFSYSTILTNLSNGLQTITVKTKNLSGAKIRISGLGLLAKILTNNAFETVTFTFKNKTKNTVLRRIELDVKMVSWAKLPDATMYDIPDTFFFCDGSEYEISFEIDTTKMLVYDNVLTCSCGAVRTNLSKYYETVPSGNAKGLLLNASYICDENYLLCALSNSNTTVRFLIAEGIRCLTLAKFFNNKKVQSMAGVTFENILNEGNLGALIEPFSAKYNQVLADIQVKTSSMPNFGCFTCNTITHNQKSGIMVSDPFLSSYNELVEQRNAEVEFYRGTVNPFLT